ncbi:hypothetical protein [Nocardia sp. NPDC051570]|uniref:hypothetical protein n=1 Tax=Nocardia sp. NPDC051570 TaxID=3364324 RepID=UPI0037B268CB
MLSIKKSPRLVARLAAATVLVTLPLVAVAAPALADVNAPSATQIDWFHHHHHHHHDMGPWQGGPGPAWQGGGWQGGGLPSTGSF